VPDSPLELILLGALNRLAGEEDGGFRRLSAERQGLARAVRDTWDEVEVTAAAHGAWVPVR
jgi:hypothetical protein